MCKISIVMLVLSAYVVRAQPIPVPNGSFESPTTTQLFGDPEIDSWLKTPQPSWWTTNDGSWTDLMGQFLNTLAGQADHLEDATGPQAGYIYSEPGAGIYQSLGATYQVGKSYNMAVSVTTSPLVPLTPGATLLLSFLYADSFSNMDTVAMNTVTFDTNIFTNTLTLLNFSVTSPTVQATDPWAGKNIVIELVATTSFDLAGGVWDLDNVQLSEPDLTNLSILPSIKNNQFTLNITGPPGQVLNILASSDLNLSLANWTTLATLTNSTGQTNFTDPTPLQTRQFYSLQPAP